MPSSSSIPRKPAIILGCALATWVAFMPQHLSASISPAAARKPAPALVLKDARGASLKLSDYKGKVLLLDFWATWCTGCKLEIPWFMEFGRGYKAKGLSALGVSVDEEGWGTVNAYLNEHPISSRGVLGNFDISERRSGFPPAGRLPSNRSQGRIGATPPGSLQKEF